MGGYVCVCFPPLTICTCQVSSHHSLGSFLLQSYLDCVRVLKRRSMSVGLSSLASSRLWSFVEVARSLALSSASSVIVADSAHDMSAFGFFASPLLWESVLGFFRVHVSNTVPSVDGKYILLCTHGAILRILMVHSANSFPLHKSFFAVLRPGMPLVVQSAVW